MLVSSQAGPSSRGISGWILDGFEQSLSKNGLQSSPVCVFEEPAHLRIWFDRLLNSIEVGRCGWWVSRNLFKATNSGVPEASTFLNLFKWIQIRLGVSTGLQELNFHHYWVYLVTIKTHSPILFPPSLKTATSGPSLERGNLCLDRCFWHQGSTHSPWGSARTYLRPLAWFSVTEKLFPLPQPPPQDPSVGPSMSFQ